MRPHEIRRFADQVRKTQEKANRFREAAKEADNEIDRARLLAAAQAMEIIGCEWADVAHELAQ